MNQQTKIIVIRMKELIIGGIVAVAALIALIFLIITLFNKPDTGSSQNTQKQNVGALTSSQNVQNSNTDSGNNSGNLTASAPTFNPGVYTASLSLSGSPVDIQITVDKHNINSIDLVQVSETVTTMYPMLSSNFEELAASVIESGSTRNISYSAENKYTSTMLLNAIQTALDKCTVN